MAANNDFEPLAASLEGWLGKSFSELPAELRQLVDKHFVLIPWDNLSPARRRSVAAQIDCGRDLANAREQDFWLTLFSHRTKWELKERGALNAGDTTYLAKELKRAKRQLAAIKKIEDYVTSIASNEQRAAAMERVLACWGERDKPTDGLKALIPQLADTSGNGAPGSGQSTALTPRPPGAATTALSAAAGREMAAWLANLMTDQPSDPITKGDAHNAAVEAGLRRISDRAFDRAWSDSVQSSGATAWAAGGRRKNRRGNRRI